ncbi:VWA domain-containing protein [Treponema sp. OMZ 840]|uniref:VWA domain-containing protein n=1 Tax=Treponema sp. OMZ 840 TaxID=244313 RepID=UPI003D930DA7
MLFERPEAFFLLTAIPPAFIYALVHIKKLVHITAFTNGGQIQIFKLRLKAVLWALAWLCAVIALAGPAWGMKPVPVERSGNAVCFVFDISYSMTAEDADEKKTVSRLDVSKQLAVKLLQNLKGTSAGVVLAKGNGVLALPLTEDYNALTNLIENLSPAMLSAPGSSIASGLERALEVFPPQSARNSFIVVFTDGDETEGSIARSVLRASNFGVQVFFVGTGSEREIEIFAGDGKTRVKTALRKAKLEKAAENDSVYYIPASDAHAADFILHRIEPFSAYFSAAAKAGTGYEMQKIKHHPVFLLLSIVFFIAGFAAVRVHIFKKIPLVYFCLLLLLTSCSAWKKEGGAVLLGSYRWSRQDYQKATAAFLTAAERAEHTQNVELRQYALYGLGSSYLMQDENAAALAKFEEIVPDAPHTVLYALWYNKGIIAYRAGDFSSAADCFKNALRIDGSKLDAKINFELCLQQKNLKTKPAVRELIPAETQSAPPGAEDAVFSLIRENDDKRWKSTYMESSQSDIPDF